MKTLPKISLCFFLLISTLISCKKEHDPELIVSTGTITGKIVAANHTTPISAATVFTTSEGRLYITHAGIDGSFSLEAPAGNRHVTIQAGDGSVFRTEVDVVVTAGQTTAIAAQAVQLTQVATLAYIAGTYDKIENILIDTMGYTATPITWAMLGDLSSITSYDAIFIDCTSESNMTGINPITDNNLATYVANGGSLYVSDWAVKSLVGQHLTATTPCNIERVGGFIPDSVLCVRKSGVIGSTLNAPITSLSLQAYLNKTNIDEIVYNLTTWEQIHYLDTNFWETMVSSPTGEPLLIRTNQYTNPSRGTVNIGNPANNGYSLVCVMGTNNQRYTLSVNSSDAASLVANGAAMGACDNPNGSGRIYYTTFHNEPNGLIGTDIKNILQYVILNL